jgi:hypothetical protein
MQYIITLADVVVGHRRKMLRAIVDLAAASKSRFGEAVSDFPADLRATQELFADPIFKNCAIFLRLPRISSPVGRTSGFPELALPSRPRPVRNAPRTTATQLLTERLNAVDHD